MHDLCDQDSGQQGNSTVTRELSYFSSDTGLFKLVSAVEQIAGLFAILKSEYAKHAHSKGILRIITQVDAVSVNSRHHSRDDAIDIIASGICKDSNINVQHLRTTNNYLGTLEQGLDFFCDATPQSCTNDIKLLHSTLTSFIATSSTKGGFSSRHNNQTDITTTSVVMTELFKVLLRQHDRPLVLRMSWLYAMMKTILPFGYGTNEITQVLMAALMVADDVPPIPMYNVMFSKTDVLSYEIMILKTENNWERWHNAFAGILLEAVQLHYNLLQKVMDIEAELAVIKCGIRNDSASIKIMETLTSSPILTATLVQDKFDISFPTACKALGKLLDLGVINLYHDIKHQKRNRIFVAEKIIDTLHECIDKNSFLFFNGSVP
jgi:hypothetical protein